MKIKKAFFILFFLFIIFSLYAENDIEILPKYMDFIYTKPVIAENLDVMPFGVSAQFEAGNSFWGMTMGFDWQHINNISYSPFEIGFSLQVPLMIGKLFMFHPYAGVSGDLCLWNDNPIYGFSWFTGTRLIIHCNMATEPGINIFYKHAYYFPIRRNENKIDVGKIGIGLTLYMSVF
jgi:hypothetical protein